MGLKAVIDMDNEIELNRNIIYLTKNGKKNTQFVWKNKTVCLAK